MRRFMMLSEGAVVFLIGMSFLYAVGSLVFQVAMWMLQL